MTEGRDWEQRKVDRMAVKIEAQANKLASQQRLMRAMLKRMNAYQAQLAAVRQDIGMAAHSARVM